MKLEDWPILGVVAVGAIGFLLMTGAFVLVGVGGGWQKAMQPDSQGRWPAPRKLMVAGAALGALFGLLFLLLFATGGIPWLR